jgi:hypothetical protein
MSVTAPLVEPLDPMRREHGRLLRGTPTSRRPALSALKATGI